VIEVPPTGPLPAHVHAPVLLTTRLPFPNLEAVLERGVEWIHILGTGVNAFPFELVGGRSLTCSRGASAVPIAEWSVAMMLAFEKRLPDMWIESPPEPPERWHWTDLGTLAGRTVAILGLGAVGTAVAERVIPFGSRVVALRRTAQLPQVTGVELAADLRALLRDADHLVIAAPSTPQTVGIIGREAFSMMKPGVHLVNISRGDLLDDDALRDALDDGTVATAALDVFDIEPLPADHWMYEHEKVRVSAHISWCAPEGLAELYQRFFDNVERWQSGRPLEYVVDMDAAY
jgi:phosphoglycerate dehydrogenase-like enzyme